MIDRWMDVWIDGWVNEKTARWIPWPKSTADLHRPVQPQLIPLVSSCRVIALWQLTDLTHAQEDEKENPTGGGFCAVALMAVSKGSFWCPGERGPSLCGAASKVPAPLPQEKVTKSIHPCADRAPAQS